MVFGKALTGAAAGAALGLGQPAIAASIATGGSLATANKIDPVKDPMSLGKRFGSTIGEGLTFNVGDNISANALNPLLAKLDPSLYRQTQVGIGGVIDAGQTYVRLFLGRYLSPNVNSAYSSQNGTRGGSSAGSISHCYGNCGVIGSKL
jgi:hypothetical protein